VVGPAEHMGAEAEASLPKLGGLAHVETGEESGK